MDQRMGGSTAPPRWVWSSARGVSVGFGIPDSNSASGHAAAMKFSHGVASGRDDGANGYSVRFTTSIGRVAPRMTANDGISARIKELKTAIAAGLGRSRV